MKKSLIALAVLAASGAAMAQSSVTLYGIADVWFGSIKTDDGKTSTTTTSMVSGGVSTSRWGMKGTEDLGGGLKANFGFEQKVNVDDGTTGTITSEDGKATKSAGFDRQAWVGLSGGFGEVRLGKTGTPFDDYAGGAHAVFDSDLAPMNLGSFPSTGFYIGKPNNGIKYTSPTMGGFAVGASYSLDEKAVAGVSVTGLGINYSGGPLGAYVVYQQQEVTGKASDATLLKAGVTYNFGMATAKAYYASTTDWDYKAGADVDEFQIGLDFPISSSLVLSGSYANADYNTQAGGMNTDGFGLALAYIMSKRTTLYGGFGMVTTDYDAAATSDKDTTAFAVGVKHVF